MTKEVKVDKKEDTISLDEAFVKEDDRVLDPSLIDKSVVERMPQPTGWRILVLPYRSIHRYVLARCTRYFPELYVKTKILGRSLVFIY